MDVPQDNQSALMALLGPGGEYEIGEDTWMCNHIPVRGKCATTFSIAFPDHHP